mmetsp:Transcript_14629/g.27420  ORF Transcript_14629/g.27420 Transcript_14629/m.27420 type:complete len:92 (+) Transcript_14629:256-531(+)
MKLKSAKYSILASLDFEIVWFTSLLMVRVQQITVLYCAFLVLTSKEETHKSESQSNAHTSQGVRCHRRPDRLLILRTGFKGKRWSLWLVML